MKLGSENYVTYTLTNVGDAPLKLEFVSGGCDCTIPDDNWSREPIAPGQSTPIKVLFKPKTKEDLGNKYSTVDIIANTEPIVTILELKAIVVE